MGSNKIIDLTGKRFGRLIVISFYGRTNATKWNCICDCGATVIVNGHDLKRESGTKSCGCYRKDMLTTHGHNSDGKITSEYGSWHSMIDRCFNRNSISYKRYGGRGVSVCDEWKNSFQAFVNDMGNKPTDKHSLERENNNGNYEPNNCRWATKAEQQNNMSSNRMLTINGETLSISQWSKKTSIKPKTIYARVGRGWSSEDAVFKKVRKRSKVNSEANA